jgi:hypothetical protein
VPDPAAFYWPLVFLHVLAFAYWLGGDFGVYVTGGYVARADLPLAERLRFLEALLRIDILPRTGIVLLPVIGLQLAALRGAIALPGWALAASWALGIAWLVLVWTVYRRRGTPSGETLQRIDVRLRLALMAVLVAVGAWSLLGDGPVREHWLAAKFLTYAALLGIGLWLRTVIKAWVEGFAALRAGPDPAAERLIAEGIRRGRRGAYLFWAVIGITAYLGLAKPF